MAHYQVDQTRAAAAKLLEFPNLRIELATASAESWRTWFKSFVIDDNCPPSALMGQIGWVEEGRISGSS